MKNSKLRILIFAIIAVLAQGTCAYADSSSDKKDYTKDELNNLTPGWGSTDIDKSNYKVNSYRNTFSSTPLTDEEKKKLEDDEKNTDSNSTTGASGTSTDDGKANVIVSTSPSTGVKGDFWGKTKDNKWILIKQGSPASGWQNVRGKWYYMDADGVMQTGWVTVGEKWYFLNSDGSMAYNTYVGGYYLGWDGAMQ